MGPCSGLWLRGSAAPLWFHQTRPTQTFFPAVSSADMTRLRERVGFHVYLLHLPACVCVYFYVMAA